MSAGPTTHLQGKVAQMSELRIVLLGKTGAGKTSMGNTIFGKEEFKNEGVKCVKRQGEVAGRQVTIVDTPGWDRVSIPRTPEHVKQEIMRSVYLCPPGPHALLLVIPVEEFSEREKKAVKKHMNLLSERVWRHTIVLFTCEEELKETTMKDHIEKEGKPLQWILEQCGNRYHVLSNTPSCPRKQVTELLEKIEELVEENCSECFLPQMYYSIIESRTPKELSELKLQYQEREEQLKQKYRKREEDLRRKFEEEWKQRESELIPGVRRRRLSIDIPPEMSTERRDNGQDEEKKEKKEPEIEKTELLEAVRAGYREEANAILKHYIKPAIVVLMAVIGGIIGAIGGAHRGTIGAVLGVPIGVVVALLITSLVRFEARAARGNTSPLTVSQQQGQRPPLHAPPSPTT